MTDVRDLSTPAKRKAVLLGIDPGDPALHHEVLRQIFPLEVARRIGDEDEEDPADDDESENVYQCAFLLHLIGDPADAPALAAAKYRTYDMDLGIGFDCEFILGAGVQETLDYLDSHGHADLADEVRQALPFLNHDRDGEVDLKRWVDFRRTYFYGDPGRSDAESTGEGE